MAQLVRRAPYSRGLVAGVVVALVAALLLISGGQDAKGAASVTTRRLGGGDRYDTAREIAVSTFGTSDFVVLARGENYPDALAGNYLAGGAPNAPILLTPRDALSQSAVDGITTLKAKGVIILGGTEAISQAVENDLKSRGLSTNRLFGADRYATAAKVATSLTPVGSVDGKPTAIIASGENFADALTGGPLSFVGRLPMLLTTKLTLPGATEGALDTLGIKHVILLGGTDAVAPTVEARLTAKGITSERLFGANRRGTATAIAAAERARFGFAPTHVNLARGDLFPDSLAGGPHAGTEKSPILLTDNPNVLGDETATYLRTNSQDITTIDAFGGTSAISDATLAAADAAATCATPASTTTTTTGTVSSTTTTTSGTVTTSAPSTTVGQPACVTPSSTTSTSGASTTSTTAPPSQSLCAVVAIPGCPGATTTTSTTSGSSTSTTTSGTVTTG
jgi:putative cell wall-binding protein